MRPIAITIDAITTSAVAAFVQYGVGMSSIILGVISYVKSAPKEHINAAIVVVFVTEMLAMTFQHSLIEVQSKLGFDFLTS